MNVETWPHCEPDTHLEVFVGSLLVNDHVYVQTAWNCCIDLLEKTEKLLMVVVRLAVGEDGVVCDVERSKQGGGSVPYIIMSDAFQIAQPYGQHRLGSAQRLNL